MLRKTIFRNSYWITTDTAVGFLSTAILSIAVARILGPVQLGYYSYILWISNIAGAFSMFGVPTATGKYASEYIGKGDPGSALGIIRSTLRIQSVSALVLAATGLAVILTVVEPDHRLYSVLVLLSTVPFSMMAVLSRANEAAEDVFANVWPSLVGTALNLVGTLTVLLLDLGLVGLASILLMSRCTDFLLRYVSYRRLYKRRFGLIEARPIPEDLRERMIRFCWQSTVLWVLNVVVWDRSDLFFVRRFCDIREVAYFSLAFNIVAQTLMIPRVFSTATGVSLMVQRGRAPETLGPLTAIVLRYMALLSIPMTLGIAALSGPMLKILYGAKYLSAIPVLALVALFAAPRALLAPAQQLLVITENQGFLTRWGLATGVLNLVLDLWWVPGGAAVGAALANGVTQAVACLGVWIFAVRQFSIRLPVAALVKTSLSAVVMAAVVAGLTFLLPPIPAAIIGVGGGALLFGCLLRWTRCLDSTDQERLLSIQPQLPSWLRPLYGRTVRMVAP